MIHENKDEVAENQVIDLISQNMEAECQRKLALKEKAFR